LPEAIIEVIVDDSIVAAEDPDNLARFDRTRKSEAYSSQPSIANVHIQEAGKRLVNIVGPHGFPSVLFLSYVSWVAEFGDHFFCCALAHRKVAKVGGFPNVIRLLLSCSWTETEGEKN